MASIPLPALYAALGAGAAMENVFPAVPADTFVALGGILTVVGDVSARDVFLVTWLSNVASALAVYRLAYRHGPGFFEHGVGRHLLNSHQMGRMRFFYDRWGTTALFLTRFLPGIRSFAPVFAGVTHQGWLPVALPLALASGIWYGALLGLGVWAGRRVALLDAILGDVNSALGVAAALVAVAALVWWWRSRHPPHE